MESSMRSVVGISGLQAGEDVKPLFMACPLSGRAFLWWEGWVTVSAPRLMVRSSPDHETDDGLTSQGWALWVGAGWLGLL
jgi:hypothetical protein